MSKERLEQRLEILAGHVGVERRLPGARVRVDDRELDLLLVGVEVEEQRVDLVHDLRDARVGPVDLVDDEDHVQLQLERLAQHEARLGQRALAGVDQQQHAVDHRQAALDLAAEVGVAGRVDDVDLRPAVADGRVLGQDRDALLALEIARVEHAILHRLVLAEGAGLPQHRVDERRLAMVDVRDDRHVADVCAFCHTCSVRDLRPDGRQDCETSSQQKTAIVKLVETAVPFVRGSSHRDRGLAREARCQGRLPCCSWETNAAPGMPVAERPAPAKLGIEACVATVRSR